MSEIMLVPFPLANSKLFISFFIFQISTLRSALVSSKLISIFSGGGNKEKLRIWKIQILFFYNTSSAGFHVFLAAESFNNPIVLQKQHSYVIKPGFM